MKSKDRLWILIWPILALTVIGSQRFTSRDRPEIIKL